MINLQTLKERETQLLARFNELQEVILNGDDSAFTEYQTITDELKGVKKAIYQIEHAEQEKQVDAEKQKANQLAAEKEMEKERQVREAAKVRADEEAQKAQLEQQKRKWDEIETRLKTKLKDRAEKIIDVLKSQFTPSTECVEPNDALTKKIFNLTKEEFLQALCGKNFSVKEKNKTKKNDAVVSKATLHKAPGSPDDETPFDEFDRAVFGVIISEYLFGNTIIPINAIYRALTGKVGKADAGFYPQKNQHAAIVNSVFKLAYYAINLKYISETLTELKYVDKDGNEITFGWELLLPVSVVYAKVNGQESTVISFKDIPPIFGIADARNQIIRYPHELLDVPGLNNTPLIIAMKKYVMRRVCEIKLHKQLTPTITFDDVFKKCRVDDTKDRRIICRYREYILKFFEHLKEQNFIKNFEVVKKGTTIHGVKFSY